MADWVLEKWTTDSTPIQNDLARLQSAEEMSARCSDFTKRKFPGFKGSKGATEYLQRYSDMATLGLESSKQELEGGTRMKVYVEKEARIQEDRNEFFSKMRPCLLQFILLQGKNHYEKWEWNNFQLKGMAEFVPSKAGTNLLYRLTTKPALEAVLGIKIGEKVKVNSKVSPNRFMTTSMGIEVAGKGSLTYLSEKEYGGDGGKFGMYDVGVEISINPENTRAVRIQKYNTHHRGQREVIFPIGTQFVVMGYTDNKKIQIVAMPGEETQVAIPQHIIKLNEVDPSL